MKKFIILLSTFCILGVSFYWLATISKQNEFTSVREYLLYAKEEPESNSWSSLTNTWVEDTTAPIIEIVNDKNGDIVNSESIDIDLEYSDNITPSENIQTTWWWTHTLKAWFNPIVVSATDEAWNTATTYIIVEKK